MVWIIGAWDLDIALRQAQGGEPVEPFAICYLMLGIFYFQAPNYFYIHARPTKCIGEAQRYPPMECIWPQTRVGFRTARLWSDGLWLTALKNISAS